jgi:hypothetical protein
MCCKVHCYTVSKTDYLVLSSVEPAYIPTTENEDLYKMYNLQHMEEYNSNLMQNENR